MNIGKRTALIVSLVALPVLGMSVLAEAEEPGRPPWVNVDGSINLEHVPATLPVVDSAGEVVGSVPMTYSAPTTGPGVVMPDADIADTQTLISVGGVVIEAPPAVNDFNVDSAGSHPSTEDVTEILP